MKYNRIQLLLLLLALLLPAGQAFADKNVGPERRGSDSRHRRMAAGCAAPSAAIDLDINNVRARIMNGGDMWWNLVGTARYEVPKVKDANEVSRHSLFAGALWIGGVDAGNNLKLAAMTYRQSGVDFYPGPLDTVFATISAQECDNWDQIWEVTREQIENWREDPSVTPPDAILDWPGNGKRETQAFYMAPYVEVDGQVGYTPRGGDYPDINGDQALWFVYNDKGNIHTESEAEAIGLEVQTMAFAYATNDEINNMTFYDNKVINRSRDALDSVYFGQWVDADLGYAFDDYIGCNVDRSLGICFNGDNFDDGVNGYGQNPPSVGVDFFQGPLDEFGNEIGMEKFVYYNNDFSPTGNPSQPIHFYQYLNGIWKDGSPIEFGGDGYQEGSVAADYMFPDDPRNPNGWSEVTAGNNPGDRRFLQSAGPFRLDPGAVNYVTTGVVWARASTGGATGSLDQLLLADDMAQTLYNNDFELIDGPDAPELVIQELDRELVLILNNTNDPQVEGYVATEINAQGDTVTYRFQGYRIYQLKNASVQPSDLENPDLAREIIQIDVDDEITDLVNQEFNPTLGQTVPVAKVINSSNEGLRHSFHLTTDFFAGGEDSLINYKSYYYMAIAYAAADDPDVDRFYLAGRRNVQSYRGIPHRSIAELGGAYLGSGYGEGPAMQRIQGMDNSGNILEITDETEAEILANGFAPYPVYKGGNTPVEVKVVDPLAVPNADFELRFEDPSLSADPPRSTQLTSSARWTLTNLTTNETIESDTTIGGNNEQIFLDWGLSIDVRETVGPGNPSEDLQNGFIEATMEFTEAGNAWLTGIEDQDGDFSGRPNPYNWIRSGETAADEANPGGSRSADDINCGGEFVDPSEAYENLIGGIIAPAAVTAVSDSTFGETVVTFGPRPATPKSECANLLENVHSIDLVYTSDRSKWTRAVVIEMGVDTGQNIGMAHRFEVRQTPSVDKDGNPDGSGTVGMSWFPGYAIDLETGHRLNIIFGEDSSLPKENGDDLIFNPTSNERSNVIDADYPNRYLFGGRHYVYVMAPWGGANDYGTPYDEGAAYYDVLSSRNFRPHVADLRRLYSSAMWVMLPMLEVGSEMLEPSEGLVPNDVRIRTRVARPLATFEPVNQPAPEDDNDGLPLYRFSTNEASPILSVEAGAEAVESIQVVPNPYYAYSEYENSQLDNRVRITNLPPRSTISIYTLDGTLIRRLEKNEGPETHQVFIDWDLKNSAGIPISSGVYIIHVESYNLAGELLGSKVIKWFGVMRPLDLDTF